jgi:hypothetical protein
MLQRGWTSTCASGKDAMLHHPEEGTVSKREDRSEGQPTRGNVLMPHDEGRGPPLAASPDFGWYLLGWIGLAFTIVGGGDLLLVWYPFRFGSPEWEFGTVTQALDGLPVTTLGLAMLLGAAVARGQRWLVRTIATVFLVLAVIIVLAAILYATNVPMALQAIEDPGIKTGLKKAIAKSAIQSAVYPLAFLWIGVKAWRHSSAV